jgi:murein DD-endopeptidase MepM/ murein hydrolase activator NlpD
VAAVARHARAVIRAAAAAALVVFASGAGTARTAGRASAGAGVETAVRYSAPVPVPLHVVRRFDPPTAPYGPGHLGVDLRVGRDATVRAAATGIVTFAGPVAGRGVVVVHHPDGIRTEYEPLRTLVTTGAHVLRGQPIGVLRGSHPGCSGVCLHWGARRGERYLDPLGLLHPLGPVVLLPWTRGAPRGGR